MYVTYVLYIYVICYRNVPLKLKIFKSLSIEASQMKDFGYSTRIFFNEIEGIRIPSKYEVKNSSQTFN